MKIALFIVALCSALLDQADTIQPRPKTGAPLVNVSLKAVYERSLIQLEASVENTSSQSISIEIPDRNPPFTISILDTSGHDIYRPVYADLTKNRHNRTVDLRIAGHESKTYRFEVTRVRDEKGNWEAIPPGAYQVEVRLARVEYINGRYNTELFVSNKVSITIPLANDDLN